MVGMIQGAYFSLHTTILQAIDMDTVDKDFIYACRQGLHSLSILSMSIAISTLTRAWKPA